MVSSTILGRHGDLYVIWVILHFRGLRLLYNLLQEWKPTSMNSLNSAEVDERPACCPTCARKILRMNQMHYTTAPATTNRAELGNIRSHTKTLQHAVSLEPRAKYNRRNHNCLINVSGQTKWSASSLHRSLPAQQPLPLHRHRLVQCVFR